MIEARRATADDAPEQDTAEDSEAVAEMLAGAAARKSLPGRIDDLDRLRARLAEFAAGHE